MRFLTEVLHCRYPDEYTEGLLNSPMPAYARSRYRLAQAVTLEADSPEQAADAALRRTYAKPLDKYGTIVLVAGRALFRTSQGWVPVTLEDH